MHSVRRQGDGAVLNPGADVNGKPDAVSTQPVPSRIDWRFGAIGRTGREMAATRIDNKARKHFAIGAKNELDFGYEGQCWLCLPARAVSVRTLLAETGFPDAGLAFQIEGGVRWTA